MTAESNALTAILNELHADDDDDSAVGRLLPYVYEELRVLAGEYLRGERSDHTLQATALVHEAYVRLAGSAGHEWNDRAHFFAWPQRQCDTS